MSAAPEMQGRIWIRMMKGHTCLRDVVVPCNRQAPQEALRNTLPDLDISQPLWLPSHEADWEEYALTRFFPEHFVDSVAFDRMELNYIYPPEEEKTARKRNPLEEV